MKLSEVRRSTPKTDVIEALHKAGACWGAIDWCQASEARTAQGLWNRCPDGCWMRWLVSRFYNEDPLSRDAWHEMDDFSNKYYPSRKKFSNWIRANYESPWLP